MQRLFFLFLVLLATTATAQNNPPQTQLDYDIIKAQRAFDSKRYNTAANLFQKIYPKVREEETKSKMLFMVAESYRKSNNFKKAFEWYEKVINARYPDPRVIYSYGLLLKNFERYDEAARQFYDYLFEVPNDPDGIREMNASYTVQQWKANPKKFTIRNVEAFNTPYSDYAPFYLPNKLIWSSSRSEATGNEIFEWTGQKCSDFFEAPLTGGVSKVKGAINTNFNEGVAWVDSSGSVMYLTQCNGTDGKGANCKIYVSYFQNGAWITPQPLPFNSDSFSTGHPAMSPNGKRMFFASNMPGAIGEKDIYVVSYDRIRDKWGVPENLGANVNTTEDDMFPYMDEDGTLYYASKGFTGMGGLDIFTTADSAGTWKKALNLQYPVNSGGDDFGISFVPKSQRVAQAPIAYLSSNREGGKGDDDIYSVSIKPFIFMVKGTVFDKEMNTPLAAANVILEDDHKQNIFTIRTNEKGEYTAELPLNAALTLAAAHPKYFRSTPVELSSHSVRTDSTAEINFSLDPIPAEDYEFTLKGILYDLDKADLRPESKRILDSLTVILHNNPTLVIELASHTDSRAPEDYNLKLSQRRAQSAVDYLIQKGIPKDRLVPVGYGESKLLNDCADGVDCPEELHQENRRTTFKVLRSDYKKRR
jgi:outer membrane protein OmpA-like peptidoglycan-associated protein/tetratricopeptide (TPR) repeat protein